MRVVREHRDDLVARIRVLAAVRLKLGSNENPGAPRARDARLRLADGTTQPARLIEFQ